MMSLQRIAFLLCLQRFKSDLSKSYEFGSSFCISSYRRQLISYPGITFFALAQNPSPSLAQSGRGLGSVTFMSASAKNMIDTGYLDAKSAASLDEELMATPGFTLEQLMELAGLSVAEAVYTVLQEEQQKSNVPTAIRILLVCGPGNNGGDGLVAARHLKLFGYDCTIVYPKRTTRQPHYANLVKQCQDLDIEILDQIPDNFREYRVIVDAIFGFSFEGEPREPFATILKQIQQSQEDGNRLVVAVDVPSGWNVNDGDFLGTGYLPEVLVSLTAPKLSAKNYPKRHFVGGRFLPPALAKKYNVSMPPYPGVAQVMEVSRGGEFPSLSAEL